MPLDAGCLQNRFHSRLLIWLGPLFHIVAFEYQILATLPFRALIKKRRFLVGEKHVFHLACKPSKGCSTLRPAPVAMSESILLGPFNLIIVRPTFFSKRRQGTSHSEVRRWIIAPLN